MENQSLKSYLDGIDLSSLPAKAKALVEKLKVADGIEDVMIDNPEYERVISYLESKKTKTPTPVTEEVSEVVTTESTPPSTKGFNMSDWLNTVVNKGESNSQFDNKKPKDWDVDMFKGWVNDNLDADGLVADKDLAKVIVFPIGVDLVDSFRKHHGSGRNDNKNYKELKTFGSGLYDIWEQIQQENGLTNSDETYSELDGIKVGGKYKHLSYGEVEVVEILKEMNGQTKFTIYVEFKKVGEENTRSEGISLFKRRVSDESSGELIKFSKEALEFVPAMQVSIVYGGLEEFQDVIKNINRIVTELPATRGQEDSSDPIIYLHYFVGGQDWYITEKDMSANDQSLGAEGHIQAFGYADLGYGAEMGYINIEELKGHGSVELDFHFEPKKWSEVKGVPAVTEEESETKEDKTLRFQEWNDFPFGADFSTLDNSPEARLYKMLSRAGATNFVPEGNYLKFDLDGNTTGLLDNYNEFKIDHLSIEAPMGRSYFGEYKNEDGSYDIEKLANELIDYLKESASEKHFMNLNKLIHLLNSYEDVNEVVTSGDNQLLFEIGKADTPNQNNRFSLISGYDHLILNHTLGAKEEYNILFTGEDNKPKTKEQLIAEVVEKAKSAPLAEGVSETPETKTESTKIYVLGDEWSEDFDYDGFLNSVISLEQVLDKVDESTVEKLRQSAEDVNYHGIAGHLYDYLNATTEENKDFHINEAISGAKVTLEEINNFDEDDDSLTEEEINQVKDKIEIFESVLEDFEGDEKSDLELKIESLKDLLEDYTPLPM